MEERVRAELYPDLSSKNNVMSKKFIVVKIFLVFFQRNIRQTLCMKRSTATKCRSLQCCGKKEEICFLKSCALELSHGGVKSNTGTVPIPDSDSEKGRVPDSKPTINCTVITRSSYRL